MLEILNSTVSSLQTSEDIDVLVVTSISNQLQLYMEAWKYSVNEMTENDKEELNKLLEAALTLGNVVKIARNGTTTTTTTTTTTKTTILTTTTTTTALNCQNQDCDTMGGKCILQGDNAPSGFESLFKCNQELNCKCFTPPCESNQCSQKGGICINKFDNPPSGYTQKGVCNQKLGCKCYVPEVCENEKCQDIFGVCVKKGDSVPFDNLYQLATGNKKYCDEASDCKCYKPKCQTTNTCKNSGGKCFSNKIVPNGWKIVKKNGKKITCKKSLNCYCYKKQGKINDVNPLISSLKYPLLISQICPKYVVIEKKVQAILITKL